MWWQQTAIPFGEVPADLNAQLLMEQADILLSKIGDEKGAKNR